MVWSVCLLGEGVDGVTQRIDLLALGAVPSPNDIDEIGVTQTTGRRLLWELQQAVVTLQEAALRAAAKERTATTSDLTLKDYRLRKVQTLFGTVSLRVPRLVNQGRIESVLPTSCGARSTRAFDDLRNKLSAWMSFRSAMALLGEMYPVEDGKSAQTAMRQIAIAAERQDNAPLCDVSLDDARIALPLDTTFVRARDTDEHRSLEILVGAVSQGAEPIRYFAAPFKQKDNCVRLGKAALAACGTGEIEAFSDSARSVRAMAKSIGVPAKPISDWFHLAMRIQHAISIADALEASTESIARANEAVHARLRVMRTELWKGDITGGARAQRAIRPHLKKHSDEPQSSPRLKRIKKLRAAMNKLGTYVRNADARIVDYCTRKIEGKRLGTSLVEGPAEFIVNARMAKSQHMRWTSKGAYNLLQVRTANINDRLVEAKNAA